MASAALHIKDSYYFEVPKPLWRPPRKTMSDFPDWWIKLDSDYQLFEAEQIHEALSDGDLFEQSKVPAWERLEHDYVQWQHDHANHGKPFTRFLKETDQAWFHEKYDPTTEEGAAWIAKWDIAIAQSSQFEQYKDTTQWEAEKIQGYEKALHGKILIPQPFGEPKNLYEPGSGFCLSKFMVIEVIVGLILICAFRWLATKIQSGGQPKGKLWNMLETVLLYLRDEVARPAIGKHDADRFVPLLWTIFLFILCCNLMGLVPWTGAPTGAFAVTFALACVTFGTVLVSGMKKFGVLGFFANLVPHMEMHLALKIPIVILLFPIELLGMLIKHGVLSVRLLANMFAGHLVLLGIMLMAFSVESAMDSGWGVTAIIVLIASTLLSLLELMVAFLQAYVFTLLSALFIGAAIHKH